jgi:5-aminolevulinate synthase
VAIVAWHLNFGVYVQPINCPTVPKNKERLKIYPTPLHSDADIEHLVEAVHSLWARRALARAVV